ncbi:MAG: hypothetical protein ABIR92_01130 [Gemmatimonadaceae bacterium]
MTRHAVRTGTLALLLCTTPVAAQRSARRVIDAAGIAAAGWHRLGDIVSALPPGATASVDGFNHALTSSRVGFMEASGSTASWRVRLDGQTMPVSVAGLWILDAIPVAITQIDSVVISEGPGIVDGHPVFLGTIDLYTRDPRKGLSAIGDYQHGDESGDPGPYRYTPRASPNVEKLGPFASGAVAFATDRVALDIGARYSTLNITDTRILSRLPAGGLVQSDVNASGGSGVMTMHVAGGDHYLVAGRGRFSGLLHFPALSGDQFRRVITSHAGATGAMIAGKLPLRYGVTATQLEIGPLGPQVVNPVEGDRLTGDAFVEAALIANRLKAGAGVDVGRQTLTASTAQRRTDRAWVTYSGAGETGTLSVQRALSNARFSGTYRRELPMADAEMAAITLTAITAWRDADNAWMDGFGSATTHDRATGMADARLEIATRDLLGLRPTWYGRGFTLSGQDDAGRDYGLAVGVTAEAPRVSRIDASIRGEISQLLGRAGRGDQSTPNGFVEASASTTTPGRFRLALSGRYAPNTRWSFPLEPNDVPVTRRIDFSVNKPMWHDRIRAQFVIRNLLNQPERSHPLGAQWNLRTHLAVTIALPPSPAGASR